MTLLAKALQRVRMVEMQYVCCTAALEMLGFILSHNNAHAALNGAISEALEAAPIEHAWDYVALHVPGQRNPLHQAVHASVLIGPDKDHIYAFVYFSMIRDLAMVMDVYLREIIETSYFSSKAEDASWYSGWKVFCVYTNIDLESVPEAPAVSAIFDITEQLHVRDRVSVDTKKFGILPAFQALTDVRNFLGGVDEMVKHDLVTRRKK